ncbi:hypothetical protein [Nocardia sp. NPDC127526]|uniref:hypothetical protein n=1 Tax=Nocardia sp. NPDC127526 TaxID=3345393 RepID=UPI00362EAC44
MTAFSYGGDLTPHIDRSEEHLAVIRKSFETDDGCEPFSFHDQSGVLLSLLEKISLTLESINEKLPPKA